MVTATNWTRPRPPIRSELPGHECIGRGLKDGTPRYEDNFLGIDHTVLTAAAPVTPGHLIIDVSFTKESEDSPRTARGTTRMLINGTETAQASMRTQPGKFTLSGEGLAIGRDTADPVSRDYPAGQLLRGIRIDHVTINLAGDRYIDEEKEALGMIARE
ncbi:hypothetical protein [Nocardia sp. CA-135398]|uniref:hypothetical protein n=1 Tax=Nocardia sp. CA-135398 TaxID=3239977 RepID=UPI003D96429D